MASFCLALPGAPSLGFRATTLLPLLESGPPLLKVGCFRGTSSQRRAQRSSPFEAAAVAALERRAPLTALRLSSQSVAEPR